ncbi:MAG: endonuclease III [Bacillota bacterium]|nr:endonuclease III [Bacillota bacterium]
MSKKIDEVIKGLRKHYPDVKPGLEYETPLQLLISTVLSAQSTDKSVNKVTKELYKKYPDLKSLLELSREEIQENIREIGIYKNKSKNIYKLLRIIKEEFNGNVPKNMKDLMKLPGVGRKTASVVLAVAFNKPAFPVDTHVYRICRRIGFTESKTPNKVSDDMMKIIPKENWIEVHHLLINHGRNICKARNPECSICNIEKYCDKVGVK